MIDGFLLLAQAAAGASDGRRWAWQSDPRTAVLIVLVSVILFGGGRRLLMARKAKQAADRLADPDVTPEEVYAAARHGRPGLIEFFRLLAEGKTPEIRAAAGRALAIVWKQDDLIPEEERAVLTRGFDVSWRARRRYPRAMTAPIPIEVTYGLPFLEPDGPGIGPDDLEWSHRIAGAERAALELPSDWKAGHGRASFSVDPGDFPTNGPHRLVLKAKARTSDRLTSNWEAEPPHVPFPIEFDPRLSLDALFTLPDVAKEAEIASAVRLMSPGSSGDDPRFLDLPGAFVVRDPPVLRVDLPLPSDLAHRVSIEFAGKPGLIPAGSLVVSAQGGKGSIDRPLGPIEGELAEPFEGPGEHRIRVVLRPDPGLGWADPDIRSLWPGEITTGWAPVRIIRR